ncbi:hypothetical protein pCPXV0036 [Cowpox virus]|uniref:Uncharacterized protein n=1 Tax=Cowpox virus TaxID=10243 RepID=A0A212PQF7_COWPX|nr:hypothetical protein pCPXV0036 [Cowpox virus]
MHMHITAFFAIHNIKMIIHYRPQMTYRFQTFHEYIIHTFFLRCYLDGTAAGIQESRYGRRKIYCIIFLPNFNFYQIWNLKHRTPFESHSHNFLSMYVYSSNLTDTISYPDVVINYRSWTE